MKVGVFIRYCSWISVSGWRVGGVGGFQEESSRLLLFSSEPQLHIRTMMLCKLGSTMPSRGLWEGSPFQQASISCQHSSSKQGSRSGLAPARGEGGVKKRQQRRQRANLGARYLF